MTSVVDLCEVDYVTAPGDQKCLSELYEHIKGSPFFREKIEQYYSSLSMEDKSAFAEDHEANLAPLAATLFHVVTYAEESEILEVAAPEMFGTPLRKRPKGRSDERHAEMSGMPPPPSKLERTVSMYGC